MFPWEREDKPINAHKFLIFYLLLLKVLPDLFRAVRMCEDGALKEFITWKLGTLISIVRQVICLSCLQIVVRFFLLQLFSGIFY